MSPHRAGEPIETPHLPVGRRVTLLADPARDAKVLGVDIWYPAGADTGERSEYELLPGVTFHAAAAQPDFIRRCDEVGAEAVGSDSESFGAMVRAQAAKIRDLVASVQLKPE